MCVCVPLDCNCIIDAHFHLGSLLAGVELCALYVCVCVYEFAWHALFFIYFFLFLFLYTGAAARLFAGNSYGSENRQSRPISQHA